MKKKKRIIKTVFKLIFITAIVISYSYYIEPKLITCKEYQIENENISENFNGFKIVHISDLYYGKTFDDKQMNKLVASINDQEPDIVVLTGDLIDKKTKLTIDISNKISEKLKEIDAKIGKYAINGDNDLKFDEWTNIINNGNFKNLNNAYDSIYKNGYDSILIAGVSTSKDKLDINEKVLKTNEYINSFEKDGPIYKILLMHEPDNIDKIKNNQFNLILSGHSMHGQIKALTIPIILEEGAKKYNQNYYKIENKELYISNGLGSPNNFRLFNTPSYNIYKLKKNWQEVILQILFLF